MKKFLIFAIISLCFSNHAISQSANDSLRIPASKQTFELLSVITPWANFSNPASVSLLKIKGFCFAESGYSYEDKDIKYTHQPGKTNSFYVGTSGYKTLGKVSFFGSFNYLNDVYNDIMYNNTLVFDKWNPYIVADTIGGKQTREAFILSGTASYKVSERLIIAGKVDYLSALGAKHKDPRNLNTISRFCFSPGLMYRTGKFTVGLSGSLYSNTNDVDIDVIGNKHYNILKFSGLGYYVPMSDVSDYETRYPARGFSVGAQLSYKSKRLENITGFSLTRESEESRWGSFFRYTDGASNTEKYNLTNHLRFIGGKGIHNLEVQGDISYLYGNDTYSIDIVQEFLEGVPYWVVVFKDPRENAIIITSESAEISYHYLTLRASGLKDFETGGTVKIDYYNSGLYPTEVYGYFKAFNLIGSFDVRKTLHPGNIFVSPSFEAFFRTNLNAEIAYKEQNQFLPEVLARNYEAMKASLYGGSLSVEIEIPSKKGFIKTYYMKPEGAYYYSPDLGGGTASNFFAKASLGFTF